MTVRLFLAPPFALLLLVIAAVSAPAAFADTFVVNATDDTSIFEPCSVSHCNLNQAINAVNARVGCPATGFCRSVIAFNLPRPLIFSFRLGPPEPIQFTNTQPVEIKQPVFIDGTTQPGFAGTPVVVIQGPGGNTTAEGLQISGGNSIVRGLVINGFSEAIRLQSNSNFVSGNYIGTNPAGATNLGNFTGVLVFRGDRNTVGGTSTDTANVISGNADGVVVRDSSHTSVIGNMIGTDAGGTVAIPNRENGVLMIGSGPTNSIGDLGTGEGNVIAFNTGPGVKIVDDSCCGEPRGHAGTVRGNSIFSNTGLGIDEFSLDPVVHPAAPTLTGASTVFATVGSGITTRIVPATTITGTFAGAPNSTISLDFYDNNTCGQGQVYVASTSVNTDATGNATFAAQFLTTFSEVTATATTANDGTSMFSNCRFVASPFSTGTPHFSPANGTVDVGQPTQYVFKWTVPPPATWHDLRSLDLRFRQAGDSVLQLHWDAASNTFSVFNPSSGHFGPAFAPGSSNVLETRSAVVYLKDTTVKGAGPTSPTVTLSLSLGAKASAAPGVYVVEAAATDDGGHADGFAAVGTLQLEGR